MNGRLAAAVLELVAALREEIREEAQAQHVERPALLDVGDAATLLNLSRTTLYSLLDRPGGIRTIRIGRRRLVARHDVEAFAARRGIAA